CYTAAMRSSERLGDLRLASYLRAYLGQLYETAGQIDDAIRLSRGAAFLAQQSGAPDLLFRWHWQVARLCKKANRLTEALQAYHASLNVLQTIRNDVALGYGQPDQSYSFRTSIGPLYYEAADLLLSCARNSADAAHKQQLLRE